jgi:hypothetical protein
MMLARVGAGTAFRAWLKAAWIAFMVLFCIRAYFFFVSLGNSGIAITCIFIAGMAAGVWHKTAHHGRPAWRAKCKQARGASQPSDRPVVVISVLVN